MFNNIEVFAIISNASDRENILWNNIIIQSKNYVIPL